MTEPGDVSQQQDLDHLKEIRDRIHRAVEIIVKLQDDQFQERKRQEDLQFQLNREKERRRELQARLDQERQRQEREAAQLKERVDDALQKGLAELFSVLGLNNPWHEAKAFRARNAELETRLVVIQRDLERLRGRNASLQTENERLRKERDELLCRERDQIFTSLLNYLGVSQLAPLLSGQRCEVDREEAIGLLKRLISFLQEQNIKVSDKPGDMVCLKDETDLQRYEINEKFHPGYAEVIQHGISYGDQVIIKARVRYKKEEVNEPEPGTNGSTERGLQS